jgi:hypothetical protein
MAAIGVSKCPILLRGLLWHIGMLDQCAFSYCLRLLVGDNFLRLRLILGRIDDRRLCHDRRRRIGLLNLRGKQGLKRQGLRVGLVGLHEVH